MNLILMLSVCLSATDYVLYCFCMCIVLCPYVFNIRLGSSLILSDSQGLVCQEHLQCVMRMSYDPSVTRQDLIRSLIRYDKISFR